MENNIWTRWKGKKIFIELKNGRKYSGKVIDVDTTSAKPLIWIIIKDKFDMEVTISHSEIAEMKEEK